MKISKIFVPNKDLNQKIEELKQPYEEKPKTIDIEDFIQNIVQILYTGIEYTKLTYPEIAKKEKEIEMRMFEKIIQDTLSGTIKWKKLSKEKYHTKACITNTLGERTIIPVVFVTRMRSYYPDGLWGFIYLGDERGPYINNTFNRERIESIALDYFKIKPKRKY